MYRINTDMDVFARMAQRELSPDYASIFSRIDPAIRPVSDSGVLARMAEERLDRYLSGRGASE